MGGRSGAKEGRSGMKRKENSFDYRAIMESPLASGAHRELALKLAENAQVSAPDALAILALAGAKPIVVEGV